jgi:hypothetical protein
VPLYTQDGNRLSKTEFQALGTTSTVTTYTLTDDVYEEYAVEGEATAFSDPEGYRMKYPRGTQLTQAQVDAMYAAATVGTLTPATGLAAGGTAVVITGTNFTLGSTVTFGGTAATSVVVTSPTRLTCVTPAKTAGTYNVVVTTDSGAATKTNGYVYT